MVAVNKANIPLISNYCMREDILIMQLRSHITKECLGYSTDYKSVFDGCKKREYQNPEGGVWIMHKRKDFFIPSFHPIICGCNTYVSYKCFYTPC